MLPRTNAHQPTHTHVRARLQTHLHAGTHKQTRARARTHTQGGKGKIDYSVAGKGVTKRTAVTKCTGSASNLIRFVTLVTR